MFLKKSFQILLRCQLNNKTSGLCATSFSTLTSGTQNHMAGLLTLNRKQSCSLVTLPVQFAQQRFFSSTPASSFYIHDKNDFDTRVLGSELPVVVDFYADWCGPCKLLGPRLDKEIDRHEGKVLLAKVDIDEMGSLAMDLQITAVPTVMVFKDGIRVDVFQGNVDDDMLKTFVKKAAAS